MIPSASSGRVNPVHTLQRQQAQRSQTNENSGRHAVYETRFISTGSGYALQPTPVIFAAPFADRPQVAYSHYIEGSQLDVTALPTITGGVYQWVRDAAGFYTGACVYCVVTIPSAAHMTGTTVEHDFTFSGTAIKAVPGYLLVGQ